MSKARQSVTPRTVASHAPAQRRELVININQQFLFTTALIIGAVVMLTGGFLVGGGWRLLARGGQAAGAANPGVSAQVQDSGGVPVDVGQKPIALDDSGLPPNVTAEYLPVSPSAVPVQAGEPRLAIVGIDDKAWLKGGDIQPGVTPFEVQLQNVGKGDLIVYQIYTCSCTSIELAGQAASTEAGVAEGKFNPPVVIKPGESKALIMRYDSTKLNDSGALVKTVQIWTNDPKAPESLFGRETRFGILANVLGG